jgi:hypothetical protein
MKKTIRFQFIIEVEFYLMIQTMMKLKENHLSYANMGSNNYFFL